MSDIVERLREWSGARTNHPALLHEAADEIERLRQELSDAKADVIRLHNEKMDAIDELIALRDASRALEEK